MKHTTALAFMFFASLTLVSASLGYNNPNLPQLQPQTPTGTGTVNNNTLVVNASQYWDTENGSLDTVGDLVSSTRGGLDNRYLRLIGGTLTGTLNFGGGSLIIDYLGAYDIVGFTQAGGVACLPLLNCFILFDPSTGAATWAATLHTFSGPISSANIITTTETNVSKSGFATNFTIGVLNVTTNATIPHFQSENQSLALDTQYQNNYTKAINVWGSMQNNVLNSGDVAYLSIQLSTNSSNSTLREVERIGFTQYAGFDGVEGLNDFAFTLNVPPTRWYKFVSVTGGSGAVTLSYTHTTEE